jgi:hypothetical protein
VTKSKISEYIDTFHEINTNAEMVEPGEISTNTITLRKAKSVYLSSVIPGIIFALPAGIMLTFPFLYTLQFLGLYKFPKTEPVGGWPILVLTVVVMVWRIIWFAVRKRIILELSDSTFLVRRSFGIIPGYWDAKVNTSEIENIRFRVWSAPRNPDRTRLYISLPIERPIKFNRQINRFNPWYKVTHIGWEKYWRQNFVVKAFKFRLGTLNHDDLEKLASKWASLHKEDAIEIERYSGNRFYDEVIAQMDVYDDQESAEEFRKIHERRDLLQMIFAVVMIVLVVGYIVLALAGVVPFPRRY